MIRVTFDPTRLDQRQANWLRRWQARADSADRQSLVEVAAGGRANTNARAAVWRDFKRWIAGEFFADKCGYCEGVLGEQTDGAAEHWRPKAAVRTFDEHGRRRVVFGGDAPHPGYWWLAFTRENLVPGCTACNKHKGTLFPIMGDRVFEHDGIPDVDALDKREKPLLLHPFRGADPAAHIGFRARGEAYAKDRSPLAAETIRTLKLNRYKLRIARARRQTSASNALALALADAARDPGFVIDEAMAAYTRAEAPYSQAVNDALDTIRGRVSTQLLQRR